jgi:hypothetical protein
MPADVSDPRSHVDWRPLHAFGLPAGSVRALLAVLVFATAWGLLVFHPYQDLPDYLRDLLFIILGHYFAARRRLGAAEEPGPPPLYLPRGSVRVVLVAGTIGVAVLLYRRGQLTDLDKHPAGVSLLLIGGFLFGVVLNAIAMWWRDRGHQTPRLVEDLRAMTAIVAAVSLAALIWNQVFVIFPTDSVHGLLPRRVQLGRFGVEHILAAVVGFYFGSRS